MHAWSCLLLVISALLPACAPLQQAPLLYSSKATVGIDVSTSTTESPGGSISFGVKIVDAAYVPVAVSKKVTDQSSSRELPSEIIRIEAIFGEGSTAGRLDSLTEENKTKIRDFLNAKLVEEKIAEGIKALEKIQSERATNREAAQASLARIETELQAFTAETSADVKQKKEAERDASKQRLEEATASFDRDAPVLESKRSELQVARATSDRLFAAAAEAASFLRTDKRDAMSVYGRFNSTGAAGAASSPSASLTAGKIFSTGVASQNLTEAVRHEAAAGSITACFQGLAKLFEGIDAGKRAELLGKFDGLCALNSNFNKKQ